MENIIRLAIAEDIGDGDHTSLAIIPTTAEGKAKLLVKEKGILAGVEVAHTVFTLIHPGLKMTSLLRDGDSVSYAILLFCLRTVYPYSGRTPSVEFYAAHSGIATQTRQYVGCYKRTGRDRDTIKPPT